MILLTKACTDNMTGVGGWSALADAGTSSATFLSAPFKKPHKSQSDASLSAVLNALFLLRKRGLLANGANVTLTVESVRAACVLVSYVARARTHQGSRYNVHRLTEATHHEADVGKAVGALVAEAGLFVTVRHLWSVRPSWLDPMALDELHGRASFHMREVRGS